jgi:L-galactose dehydrogenase
MKYRKLGNTGIDISVLGFGGSSLGSVFRKIDEAEGIRAVHVSVENGINLIDTAPFYGLTRAETVLGKALREIPRDKYCLATKVGRYGYKQKDFDFSAKRVTKSVDESLQRLGVDYVDFIQVHDMEFGHPDQIIAETLPALREVQAAGKARYVGITCLPIKLYKYVMDRAEVDQIQSYCHYCLNDTSLLSLLPYFKDRGVAVFNSAPLAMRLLTLEDPPDWHPASAELRAKCAEAARYCQQRGADIAKLALQFSVANPDIPVNIIGSADPNRMLKNIQEIDEPLDEELLLEVLNILEPVHNVTWPSGRPENS